MVGITALFQFELPGGTVYLSDGGVTPWNGNDYVPRDDLLGAIESLSTGAEGESSSIPAWEFTFAAPGVTAVTEFTNGALQQSRVRAWLAEYDTETGEVVGDPELRHDGFVDRPSVSFAYKQFNVRIGTVPYLEVLFFRDDGNGLSPSFHKSIYPGELGHDNAIGLTVTEAWGVESARTSGSASGGRGFLGEVFNVVEN